MFAIITHSVLFWNSLALLASFNATMPANVTVDYKGEGFYEYNIKLNPSLPKIHFWTSFWGIGECIFSPDKKYMVLQDSQRMGVMSPVLIFRIENNSVALVYQTPAHFENEECYFDYSIVVINNDYVVIRVRPSEYALVEKLVTGDVDGFTYKVYLDRLSATRNTFYDTSDSRYFAR